MCSCGLRIRFDYASLCPLLLPSSGNPSELKCVDKFCKYHLQRLALPSDLIDSPNSEVLGFSIYSPNSEVLGFSICAKKRIV